MSLGCPTDRPIEGLCDYRAELAVRVSDQSDRVGAEQRSSSAPTLTLLQADLSLAGVQVDVEFAVIARAGFTWWTEHISGQPATTAMLHLVHTCRNIKADYVS